jgi:predicted DNA-binding transcriptional regulator YafY
MLCRRFRTKLVRIIWEIERIKQGAISTNQLALETGQNLRTIQRDMIDIQDSGFPIYNPSKGIVAFLE